jgi:DNA-binding IclR family transcriptional regulator
MGGTAEVPVDPDSGGLRGVQRALDVLFLLDEQRQSLSIRDVVSATGIPKTTVLRLLQTLQMNGMLWLGDDGKYVAGPSLLRWTRLAAEAWQLPVEMRKSMRDLAMEHKETVHVYVRRNLSRICIAQEEGPQTLRHVVNVGDERPMWAGAVAKVLLLDATPDLLLRVAQSSPQGESHLPALKGWVEQVTADGYAVSHGDLEEGLSAVAVPILDRNGRLIAALSFGGPTTRFTDDRVARFAVALTRVADRFRGTPLGALSQTAD